MAWLFFCIHFVHSHKSIYMHSTSTVDTLQCYNPSIVALMTEESNFAAQLSNDFVRSLYSSILMTIGKKDLVHSSSAKHHRLYSLPSQSAFGRFLTFKLCWLAGFKATSQILFICKSLLLPFLMMHQQQLKEIGNWF